MRISRTTLIVAITWSLFLLLMVSVALQDYVRSGGTEYWQPVLWEVSSNVYGLAFLVFQRRMMRRYDHLTRQPAQWFARQFAWLPLFCLLFVPAVFGMRHAGYAIMGQAYEHQPWLELYVYESIKSSVFYSLIMLAIFGMLSYRALVREQLLLREAQLQRLTQQMQPHFLFNALNTISSLMHTDVERADATLIQLADVLRTTLDVADQHEAPLSTELRLLRGYARVMEERYADRVNIDWSIEEAALACPVPVMSTQPLLENVFKHTVEKRSGLTRIAISASCKDGELAFAIEDDSGRLGQSAGGSGIGLNNLRERLQVLHGGKASLALVQLNPAGVRAEMRLPCAC
jgi:glucose-6-phosphate-specific signal transduction histidine kinase